MTFLRGLTGIAVSAAALATSATGVAVYATTMPADAVGVPDAVVSPADAPARGLELSRSDERPELDAATASRAEELSLVVEKITEHDAALKAEAAAKQAEADRIKRELGYDPATKAPKEIARQIAANKYGWGDDQFQCYDNIIMRESRWDPFADNPTSSAYGIPQALPGSRMASHGADWRTNPATQIRWGLDYVKERYGTPCAAWSFKRARGWY